MWQKCLEAPYPSYSEYQQGVCQSPSIKQHISQIHAKSKSQLLGTSPKLNKKKMVPDDTIHQLTGRYFPATKQSAEGTKDKRALKICRVCYAQNIKTKKGQPVKIVCICKPCPSEPGLHIDHCPEIYHAILDFSQ